jgi:hypothetical protein
MKKVERTIDQVFVSVVFSLATVFLAIAGLVGYAFIGEQAAVLPGIFRVWVTSENDAPAVNFEPNLIGIFIAVTAIALTYASSATCSMFTKDASDNLSGSQS